MSRKNARGTAVGLPAYSTKLWHDPHVITRTSTETFLKGDETMRITDFETGRHLNDVCLTLTQEEAEELRDYLNRLTRHAELGHVHLTEFDGTQVGREFAVSLA